MKIKDTLDLCGWGLHNFCIQNHDDLETLQNLGLGRKIFYTGNSNDKHHREVIYDGSTWRVSAYMSDVEGVQSNLSALTERVNAFLDGEVNSNEVLDNLKEIQAFLDAYPEATSLAEILDTKFDKAGGTIESPIIVNSEYNYAITKNATGNWTGIRYRINATTKGYLGINDQEKPIYVDSKQSQIYFLLHQGNYSDLISELNLNLTLYGQLKINNANPSIQFANGNVTYGRLAWNPNSGLVMTDSSWNKEYILLRNDNYSDLITGTLGVDITGNAATATKLQTARTIWGQSFDGTGNVDGNIVSAREDFRLYNKTNRLFLQSTTGALILGEGTAADASTFILGKDIYFGRTTSLKSMLINSSGNVTIGSEDKAGTDAKLYVDGGIVVGKNATIGVTDSNDKRLPALQLNNSNNTHNLLLGQYTAKEGYNTVIYGNEIRLCYSNAGTSSLTALLVNSSGNVLIGATEDDDSGAKLQVSGKINTNAGYYIGTYSALESFGSDGLYIGYETAVKGSSATKLWGNGIKFVNSSGQNIARFNNDKTVEFDGLLTANAGIKVSEGGATIKGDLYVEGNIIATKEVSAGGAGTEGNGGAGGFSLYESWGTSAPTEPLALGANLGYELKTRVEDLELAKTKVTFEPVLVSGKQIGTIEIDGNKTNLFAPATYAWSEITGTENVLLKSGGTIYKDNNNVPLAIKAESEYAGLGLKIGENGRAVLAYYGGLDWRVTNESYQSEAKILHNLNFVSLIGDTYLKTTGGTINSPSAGALEIRRADSLASIIKYSNKDGALGYIGFTSTKKPVIYDSNMSMAGYIIHSGNVGDYAPLRKSRQSTIDLNTAANGFYEIGYSGQTITNAPSDYNSAGALLIDARDSNGYAKLQFLGVDNRLYYRMEQSGNATITSKWKTIAFTDSNVAGAKTLVNDAGDTILIASNSNRLSDWQNLQLYESGSTGVSAYPYYQTFGSPSNSVAAVLQGGVLAAIKVNGRERFWVNSSGNVTIGDQDYAGTSTKLHVDGDISTSGNFLFNHTKGLGFATSDGKAISIFVDNYNNLHLGYQNVNSVRFNSGNVLIGTTTDNGAKLQVKGDVKLLSKESWQTEYTTISASGIAYYGRTAGGYYQGASFYDFNKKELAFAGAYASSSGLINYIIGKNYSLPWFTINSENSEFKVLTSFAAGANASSLEVNGTSAFGGQSTFNAQSVFNAPVVIKDRNTLQIGDAVLMWDKDKKVLTVDKSFASMGEISAGGTGTEGGNTGGGGTGTITNPYVVNFTPSQETSHSFYHNLPYYDVVVQVYEKNAISGAWDMILADVTIANESRLVTVDFGRKENVEHKIVVR